MFFAPVKSRQGTKIWNMSVSKTIDYIQIKIKMSKSSQEPPESYKASNQDLKDMDVICTLKPKIKSQNLVYGCIEDQSTYPNQDQDAKLHSEPPSILSSPK